MVLLRLYGVHLRVSFISCEGNLIEKSGLDEIPTAAFVDIEKVVNGKNSPQNFCALRMVFEDLLQPVLKDIDQENELDYFFNEKDESKI